MALTLYGLGPSRSFRCLWALEEAALEYDYINIEMGSNEKNGAQSDEYLNINSQGKVPALAHDDFSLTESAAILNYIDSLAQQSFIPSQPQQRAKYDELAFFVLSELEQPLWTIGKHKFAIPEQYRISEIFTTAAWEFDKAIKALGNITDIGNGEQRYALGDTFSFADVLIAQTINWADVFKMEVPAEYLTYRDTMYARPAVKNAKAKFA